MNPLLMEVQQYVWCSFAVIFFLWGFNFQPYTLVDASSTVIFFLSPQGFQLPTFCAGWCSSAISSFSFLGVQLPTFRAGWFSSAVIFFLSPRGFQLPSFHACWCSSTVIFFLSPRGFQLLLFRVHGYFSAVR